jgi:chromosome segregation ATPase
VSFQVKPLTTGGLVAGDPAAVLRFQQRSAELFRTVSGLNGTADELESRIDHLQLALDQTPGATQAHGEQLDRLRTRLLDLRVGLNGDRTRSRRAAPAPLALRARVGYLLDGYWSSRTAVPGEYEESMAVAETQLQETLSDLAGLSDDLAALEEELETLGAPWTPGRMPRWD